MKKIAIYGKGGIGKSTTVSNLSAALARRGLKVMQIGCDPKADSTKGLTGGQPITSVLDVLKVKKTRSTLDDLVVEGDLGVLCVEAGGPTPGIGCAGRGIISAFDRLEELDAWGRLRPDVVLFDVLGDVVCGGFA
ncbi:AAA family ATPase, partial [Rhodopseudomonas palustris]